MTQNLDPVWSYLSLVTTSFKCIDLGGHLRKVQLYLNIIFIFQKILF